MPFGASKKTGGGFLGCGERNISKTGACTCANPGPRKKAPRGIKQ